VGLVFWAFRVMIAMGSAMVLLGLYSAWLRVRGRFYDTPLLYRGALWMAPSGFIAVLAGWIVTEVGRQPFTIYGVMRTSASLGPVEAPAIGASLLAFIVVYFALFGAGTYYIIGLMAKAPDGSGVDEGVPLRAAGTTQAASLKPDLMRGAPAHG